MAHSKRVTAYEQRRSLTVSGVLEVDVRVTEGAARDHVATDADGKDRSSGGELFKEHRLGNFWMEVSDVE